MAERIHPGFVPEMDMQDISLADLDKTIAETPQRLEDYLPFVSLEGLNDHEKRILIEAIEEIFKKTGGYWHPQYCAEYYQTVSRSTGAEGIQINSNEWELCVVASESLEHMWTELRDGGLPNRRIVIDPTGIGPEGESKGQYQPYFGLLENASETSRMYYTNAFFFPLEESPYSEIY